MGLYIPNVRLPENEEFELWIAVRKDGSFTYNIREGWQDGKQKAVPVQLHGKLIDVDKLPISTAVPLDGKPYQYVHIDNIKAAPTIIPASNGGKT